VGEHDRERHQLRGLPARVAEHEPLISRAERVHAHGDVRRLLVDRRDDAAGLVVEAVLGAGVAHLFDRLAGDPRDVHVAGGRDLPRHHHEAGGEEALARDAARGILSDDRIEHRVRDLIGDLVRVPLRHRLGGEEVFGLRHVTPPVGILALPLKSAL